MAVADSTPGALPVSAGKTSGSQRPLSLALPPSDFSQVTSLPWLQTHTLTPLPPCPCAVRNTTGWQRGDILQRQLCFFSQASKGRCVTHPSLGGPCGRWILGCHKGLPTAKASWRTAGPWRLCQGGTPPRPSCCFCPGLSQLNKQITLVLSLGSSRQLPSPPDHSPLLPPHPSLSCRGLHQLSSVLPAPLPPPHL